MVCQIAAQHPEVRAVVTDSIYPQLFPVLRDAILERYRVPAFLARCTWWGLQLALRRRLGPRDPEALAARLTCPLLAIQGEADARVPEAWARVFYERWAGPKARWTEPEVMHVGMSAKSLEAYCDRVAAFFTEALSG